MMRAPALMPGTPLIMIVCSHHAVVGPHRTLEFPQTCYGGKVCAILHLQVQAVHTSAHLRTTLLCVIA